MKCLNSGNYFHIVIPIPGHIVTEAALAGNRTRPPSVQKIIIPLSVLK